MNINRHTLLRPGLFVGLALALGACGSAESTEHAPVNEPSTLQGTSALQAESGTPAATATMRTASLTDVLALKKKLRVHLEAICSPQNADFESCVQSRHDELVVFGDLDKELNQNCLIPPRGIKEPNGPLPIPPGPAQRGGGLPPAGLGGFPPPPPPVEPDPAQMPDEVKQELTAKVATSACQTTFSQVTSKLSNLE